MGIGPHDANAIFSYQGVWHVMHQANWTDWAHLVSTDLAHWTRLPSALFPNGDWDGSLTLLDGKPVILYDCYNVQDCLPPNSSHGLGDNPLVGVARPADLADPNLTLWRKDPRNPISITDQAGNPVSRGFAGPSNIWRRAGRFTMAMQLGGAIARLESTDPDLHNWTVADPTWFAGGGRGGHGSTGVSFFPAPGGSDPDLYMLGGTWSNGNPGYPVGTPWYYLGHYDNSSGNFSELRPAQPIEASTNVIWSTSHTEPSGRMLYLGWLNLGAGCLTAPRQVTYDPSTGKLLAMPVSELQALRGSSLGARPASTVKPGLPLALFDLGSSSFDLLVNVSLSRPVQLRLALLASSIGLAQALLDVNVSGTRQVNMSLTVPNASPRQASLNTSFSFVMAAAGSELDLRVMADKAVVEVYVGGGRGVISTGVLSPGVDPSMDRAFLAATSDSAVVVEGTEAWQMGCGWA